MDSFINEKYTILDGTLLALNDLNRELFIPATVGGHRITRVGSGVNCAKDLWRISFAEGITHIGREVFGAAENINEILLPATLREIDEWNIAASAREEGRLKITLKRTFNNADELDEIMASSLMTDHDRYILTSHANDPRFLNVLRGLSLTTNGLRQAAVIDRRMNGLYRADAQGRTMDQMPFVGRRGKIPVGRGDNENTFRRAMVKQLLKEDGVYHIDGESESFHETEIMKNQSFGPGHVALLTFYGREIQTDNETWTIPFHVSMGTYYYPELVKVVLKGRNHYIYRQISLATGARSLGDRGERQFYIRECRTEVYDENGDPLNDIATAKAVFAKYKLTAMLR
ncbi:MAG: hypothetical protein IKN24_06645 [Lachnospiraceae bacterium]|nr:hypothetical protein [Lachnospiraceae bacterium]